MKHPDTKARLDAIGAEPIGSTPEQLAAHPDKELMRWNKLIADRKIHID